ncbi:hypothetical protein BJP36_39250 [Moorena producens JHB]|uniref:Uncharacterized protein n=1 Tax=Moorena producens (strain JHB) TaxID=1454205 RepID=A0A9Q9SUZ2_MOOP1|nr:Rpn family recombination-promoting nuclease/putative transposase [Moorena producens]WAN70095.1 hypothetical protein BJP36_39250 [Moorena producens JHB]
MFVELPKFEKQLEELDQLDELWMYFLKNAPSLETVPPKMANKRKRIQGKTTSF